MATGVLRVTEHDADDGTPGRLFELSDVEFTPLGYAELRDAKLARPMKIPLRGRGTKTVASDVGCVGVAEAGRFHTFLESYFTSRAIGLVKGGWLPSALAISSDTIVLPDRCVVAQLEARLQGGKTRNELEEDFLDLFAHSPVRINPLLFVLEGNARRTPTPEQARAQLREAVAKLQSALPRAIMVAADEGGLKGVLGLVEDSCPGIARKQDFLLRLAPSLASPVGKTRLPSLWKKVTAAAKDCGLSNNSLVVLATLSSILMPNGSSPARGILKFGPGYTEEHAYNALADLRALDILMCLFALYPNQRLMLCTSDKDMALFWVGLGASNFALSDGYPSFTVTPTELLPGITEAQWESVFYSE
jgi:hypothetical protein